MDKPEYIVIDRKVAAQFIHQANHLSMQFIPEPIKQMEITLTTGGTITIAQLFEQAKDRVDLLADYIRLAMEERVLNRKR